MIELTKLNNELMMINPSQIECIEIIPESKIIMMNGRYHIVTESKDVIIKKIIKFYNLCNSNPVFKLED